jgi:hypothetical protein
MSEDLNPNDQLFENLTPQQIIVNNLFNSEFETYFTENNITKKKLKDLASRKLETENKYTRKSENLSMDPDDNILNFVYLSYEYVLDEYFEQYRAHIISNIQDSENYKLVFKDVQNFEYFKVGTDNDEYSIGNVQYLTVKKEIDKVLEQIRTYGVTSTFFLAYLKDRFSSYKDLERMLSIYLDSDLEVLLENQFIK